MNSGWNNSGWLADVLYIYPNKAKKYTFEDDMEAKQKAMKANELSSLKKPNLSAVDMYKSGKSKGKSEKHETIDKDAFMDMVSKDLNQKKDLAESNLKSQKEEYKHMYKVHKLEKASNMTKKITKDEKSEGQKITFNFENWKEKFIYPYLKDVSEYIQCEDEAGRIKEYCEIKISTTEDLINTTLLNFPLDAISTQKDYLSELQKPITITIEDLQKDLYKFQKDFPIGSLPNIDYSEQEPDDPNKARNENKPATLNISDVNHALKKINSSDVSRLIGLVAHFTYWCIFGHINQVPLDEYHKRQLFISITQIQANLETSRATKKIFTVFTMPMIVLSVRALIDHIFRSTYIKFYEEQRHDMILSKLINDVITILLDPNMYYSRFSFFESEKDAMKLTYHKVRASKLPKINSKLFTRSALVKSLFPVPSEGKVRAMFGNSSQENLRAKTSAGGQRRVHTNISTQETYANVPTKVSTAVPGDRNRRKISQFESRQEGSAKSLMTINSFRNKSRARTSQGGARNQYENTLNMINKVQMFQIAVTKVNKNLVSRKKPPIFKIHSDDM